LEKIFRKGRKKKMIESAEEFVRLRRSDKLDEYRRAACDSASDEVWLGLINNYPEMRGWVAHNKTVKGKILEILAKDKDWRVRAEVALRRASGLEILKKLAFDSEFRVRRTVANNPKVTKEILLDLANDESVDVRKIAIERLKNFNG
jgi:hypothetical protein